MGKHEEKPKDTTIDEKPIMEGEEAHVVRLGLRDHRVKLMGPGRAQVVRTQTTNYMPQRTLRISTGEGGEGFRDARGLKLKMGVVEGRDSRFPFSLSRHGFFLRKHIQNFAAHLFPDNILRFTALRMPRVWEPYFDKGDHAPKVTVHEVSATKRRRYVGRPEFYSRLIVGRRDTETMRYLKLLFYQHSELLNEARRKADASLGNATPLSRVYGTSVAAKVQDAREEVASTFDKEVEGMGVWPEVHEAARRIITSGVNLYHPQLNFDIDSRTGKPIFFEVMPHILSDPKDPSGKSIPPLQLWINHIEGLDDEHQRMTAYKKLIRILEHAENAANDYVDNGLPVQDEEERRVIKNREKLPQIRGDLKRRLGELQKMNRQEFERRKEQRKRPRK